MLGKYISPRQKLTYIYVNLKLCVESLTKMFSVLYVTSSKYPVVYPKKHLNMIQLNVIISVYNSPHFISLRLP